MLAAYAHEVAHGLGRGIRIAPLYGLKQLVRRRRKLIAGWGLMQPGGLEPPFELEPDPADDQSQHQIAAGLDQQLDELVNGSLMVGLVRCLADLLNQVSDALAVLLAAVLDRAAHGGGHERLHHLEDLLDQLRIRQLL